MILQTGEAMQLAQRARMNDRIGAGTGLGIRKFKRKIPMTAMRPLRKTVLKERLRVG